MAIVTGDLTVELTQATVSARIVVPLDEPLDIVLLTQPTSLIPLDLSHLVATFGPLISLAWSVSVESPGVPSPALIPLPATFWLLACAAGTLAWFSRSRNR